MGMWIPQADQEYTLDRIAEADEQCVCSIQPATYYNACRGILWTLETAIGLGVVVYPPTPNGYVYECITAGTTGALEPAWGTVQDAVFTDGTVEWKTHENYALANAALAPSDFTKSAATIEDDGVLGRKLVIAQKIGVVTHSSGNVTHTAFIRFADKSVRAVTTAQTTLGGDNSVEAGRTTIFFEMKIIAKNPEAVV